MTRKVYVLGYQSIPEDKTVPPRPFDPDLVEYTKWQVGYSAEPKPSFTFPKRSLAEDECALLRSWNVRIGEHSCDFEVEALKDGEFTVVCLSHPPHLKFLTVKPVAVCTRCGHFSYNATLINEQCGQRPDGKQRCTGVNGSALNVDDWKRCSVCMGQGCEACQRSGWEFVRR